VITVDEKEYASGVRAKAKLEELKLAGNTEEGMGLIKGGKYGAGVLKIAGGWGPLITAALAGGAIFALSEMKSVKGIQFFKDHWYARGIAGLLLAAFLWKKGYQVWAAALASTALGLMYADHENRQGAPPKEASGPEDPDAGYWIGGAWYPRRHWDDPRLVERYRLEELLPARRAAEARAERLYEVGV
jgi:hypothetical protein